MEKKEREALKKRLLEMVINEPPYPYPITMAEIMVNDMSKPNLKPLLNFIEKELDKAREEGRREVLNKETFIGEYDILMQGLHIRTIDRENFLAQIYKTVKERYDWAFGTATYKQALKMIENSLTSPLTPYVGTDKMIDEARIEVLSKLTTK